MRTYLTLKNYRCFVRPVTIEITKGFTAFVGMNNAGKSTVMRFLLEFRPLISNLANLNSIQSLATGQMLAVPNFLHVLDILEVFSNLNQNPIELSIRLHYEGDETAKLGNQTEEVYRFAILRNMSVSCQLSVDGGEVGRHQPGVAIGEGRITRNNRPFINFQNLAGVLLSLSNSLYIGPFRNTINAGAKTDYLDIGLARAAASRVYSVIRVGEGDSDIRSLEGTPRLAEFLGEMSFSSHKELGFEKILLVEGPTEVPTIQQFLRKLGKDHQILLLPLHGHMPKADELEEILRISTDVAVLIDSEKTAEAAPLNKDRREFLSLCATKSLKNHALERRAIENYFPDVIVKKNFGGTFRALAPFERLADVNPHWSKSQNWKMAADMTFDDIRETDLGIFLQQL